MVATNPSAINGRWEAGVALDVHTISSAFLGVNDLGHDVYATTRSELGELLMRLKYRSDQSAAQAIIETAAEFLRPHFHKFDRIIPVPPSTNRAIQPVILLANGIGQVLNVPVLNCVTATRPTNQLKDVSDPARRQELLEGLYDVDPTKTEGGRILLFDDLFRSGATMNAITDLLLSKGKAQSVRAITITRTRSNQ